MKWIFKKEMLLRLKRNQKIKQKMSKRYYAVIFIFIWILNGCKNEKEVTTLNTGVTKTVSKRINLLTGNAKFKVIEVDEKGKKISIAKGKSCETCAKGNNLIFEMVEKYDEKGNLTEKQISKRNKETILYKYNNNKLIKIDTIKKIVIQLE